MRALVEDARCERVGLPLRLLAHYRSVHLP
jgi:hypothetical protein